MKSNGQYRRRIFLRLRRFRRSTFYDIVTSKVIVILLVKQNGEESRVGTVYFFNILLGLGFSLSDRICAQI